MIAIENSLLYSHIPRGGDIHAPGAVQGGARVSQEGEGENLDKSLFWYA